MKLLLSIYVLRFLKDATKERTMEYNNAYAEFFEEKGLTTLPRKISQLIFYWWTNWARITVGCGELALGNKEMFLCIHNYLVSKWGANMEIEADAYLP